MGYPMAGYLSKSGHEVVVYNRTAAKADSWREQYDGSSETTPAEAAQYAEIVFTCVGNDDDVREVVLGDDGIINGISSGSIIVDHTTASATLARKIHGIASEKSIGFLDAPLSADDHGRW
jgi:3-hydroxyisobutyrate dehydrogenase-like beta-hydroxyacid dehydrogenase